MGCGGSKQDSLERIGPRAYASQGNKVAIWGDYFDAETRAIIAILEMTKTPYTFNEIDTLKDQHL